jgi:hypothetical protein
MLLLGMRVPISTPVLAAVSHIDDRQLIHRFFDGVKRILESLSITPEDKRLSLTAPKAEMDLRVNINGRLVYALTAMEDGFRWLFMLRESDLEQWNPSYRIEPSQRFSGTDRMLLYEAFTTTLTDDGYQQLFSLLLEACREYLPTQSGSRFRNRHRPELYELAMDAAFRDEVLVQSMDEDVLPEHPFEYLIDAYKDQLRTDSGLPHHQPWICTQTFQTHWDPDAPNLEAMLKAALRDRGDLLHPSASGFLFLAARFFPDTVRDLFRQLFDERKALTTRLRRFTQAAALLQADLQRLQGRSPKHAQDERTIAFYLAMRFPERYPLYRQDAYHLLLQTVLYRSNPARAAEHRKAGARLLHYLELGNELVPLLTEDEDLEIAVASALSPDCWNGAQHWLIFQDVLRYHRELATRPELAPPAKNYDPVDSVSLAAESDIAYAQQTPSVMTPLNVIFYGPPGTGKTYATLEAAIDRADPSFQPIGSTAEAQRAQYRARYETLVRNGQIAFITFHQSLSYEDFIEGIKPNPPESGAAFLSYAVRDGLFKKIALRAAGSSRPHVLIIDEINRGQASQIFGELITLLEDDKRTGGREALTVTLPYSGMPFSVPSNLYLIGTMNTADRSVEALDIALRRRFSFIEMTPKEDLIAGTVRIHTTDYSFREILSAINTRLEILAGRDHLIGPSYFLHLGTDWRVYLHVFTDRIVPLLQEYFYGNYSRICLVLGTGFVTLTANPNPETLFARLPANSLAADGTTGFQEPERWTIVDWTAATEEQFAAALDILLNRP